MTVSRRSWAIAAVVILLALGAPIVVPGLKVQLAILCIMVVLALTWDTLGGQMGYNSFGNVLFFGVGMYASAITQVGLFHDVGAYTAVSGSGTFAFSPTQYFVGLASGLLAAPVAAVVFAAALGTGLLGLRGHYFAIATLGLGIAGGEFAASWEYIGGASGFHLPLFPGDFDDRALFSTAWHSPWPWPRHSCFAFSIRGGLASCSMPSATMRTKPKRSASSPSGTRSSHGASLRPSSAWRAPSSETSTV